jgi:hypothetical protein
MTTYTAVNIMCVDERYKFYIDDIIVCQYIFLAVNYWRSMYVPALHYHFSFAWCGKSWPMGASLEVCIQRSYTIQVFSDCPWIMTIAQMCNIMHKYNLCFVGCL